MSAPTARRHGWFARRWAVDLVTPAGHVIAVYGWTERGVRENARDLLTEWETDRWEREKHPSPLKLEFTGNLGDIDMEKLKALFNEARYRPAQRWLVAPTTAGASLPDCTYVCRALRIHGQGGHMEPREDGTCPWCAKPVSAPPASTDSEKGPADGDA